MKSIRFTPLAFLFLATVPFMQGQQSTTLTGNDRSYTATASFNVRDHAITPVTGAPYCADEVSERQQTLADGTHIDQTTTNGHTCRDSAGRTRTERALFRGMMGRGTHPPDIKVIEINDPVAGFTCTLDTQNKIAHRVKLPVAQPTNRPRLDRTTSFTTNGPWVEMPNAVSVRPPAPNDSADNLTPQSTTESLGSKTINGVQVEGRLHKTIYPVNYEGNDRPITETMETWFASNLQLNVLSTRSDPRQGDQINRLDNLTTGEPDPTLFQVSSDYQIVDETAPFKLTYTTR
jgi:hypothetical protein